MSRAAGHVLGQDSEQQFIQFRYRGVAVQLAESLRKALDDS